MRFPARAAAALAAALIAFVLVLAPPARADGDPASDVLLGQDVFYPYSPPVSTSLQNALNAETATAAHAQFPIKVALIGSPLDLGAIPSLFGKPQQYADFLDQEISYQHQQPLLVVMPDGYGVQGLSRATAAAVATLTRPRGSPPDDLARAAIAAVGALAAVAGHPITQTRAPASGGSGHGSTPLAVLVLALAAVAVAGSLIALRVRERPTSRRRARSRSARRVPARRTSGATYTFTYAPRAGLIQPRLVVGALLIAGGLLWALARGLNFYGVGLADVGYDLDQPPLLLLLVGGWLVYRSARA